MCPRQESHLRHTVQEAVADGLARRAETESEGSSLAVPADAPSLPRVNDLSAELADPVQRDLHVRNGEIRERYTVARSRAPRVQAERRTVSAGLPAFSFDGATFRELDTQDPRPETARPGRLIGGELHEADRGRHPVTIADVVVKPRRASGPMTDPSGTRSYAFARSPDAADLSMAAMTWWRRTASAKSGTE